MDFWGLFWAHFGVSFIISDCSGEVNAFQATMETQEHLESTTLEIPYFLDYRSPRFWLCNLKLNKRMINQPGATTWKTRPATVPGGGSNPSCQDSEKLKSWQQIKRSRRWCISLWKWCSCKSGTKDEEFNGFYDKDRNRAPLKCVGEKTQQNKIHR